MQHWLNIYSAEFDGNWIRWENDGEVVGGCLILFNVVRKGIIPLRSGYFNATGQTRERTPFSEFNDLLFVEQHRQEIAADLCQILESLSWDRLFISGYESSGVLHDLARVIRGAEITHDLQIAPYVDIAGLKPPTFESSLSANTRSQIRRSQKRYEEKQGLLKLTRATNTDEALDYLAQLAILHNKRREAKGELGSFSSRLVLAFHKNLVATLFATKEVDLLRLNAGDTTIGYLYNFVMRGKVYFFQSGFRYESDPKMKPGLLTHSFAIQQYIADGQLEYDFLAGDSQYKRSLANEKRTLIWTTVYRDKPRIRLLLAVRRIWHYIRGIKNRRAEESVALVEQQ